MIERTRGDITRAQAEAVVNTVNCVGVMGRGIALQFKRRFPENFKAYAAACRRAEVVPGRVFVHETGRLVLPRFIINFPTKRHWRGNSRMTDIEAGLADLVAVVERLGIRSIAVPALGCGLGGLEWNDVRPRIERAFALLPEVRVLLFEPGGEPTEVVAGDGDAPAMTGGRAALVALMDRYLVGLMDPFITLLEVHKLMYFLQESGERLRLDYVKGLYGPYAENLRHVLSHVEGHFVNGYADGGDQPGKTLELAPGAIEKARAHLLEHDDTRDRLARVADLVTGFETPFGLELLATVHWVATRDGAASAEEAVNGAYAWNERKRRFSPEQIRLAWDVLSAKAWLRPQSRERRP